MTRRLFTDEQEQFLRENYKGLGNQALTDLMNETFGMSLIIGQIKAFKSRHKLDSGLTGRFEKGQTSWNKGRKGWCPPGSEKGWFKKGNSPWNERQLGDERLEKGGYTYVKVEQKGTQWVRWRFKHRVIWEEHHGAIPEGHVVVFKDQDKTNFDIDNLELVKREEMALMNKHNLFTHDQELTTAGLLLSRVHLKIREATQ